MKASLIICLLLVCGIASVSSAILTSQAQCTASTGYVWAGDSCQQCSSTACTCKTPGTCDSCPTGSLATYNSANAITSCTTGSSYFTSLYSDQAGKCTTACIDYTAGTSNCQTCATGNYLYQGKCITCTTGASACTAPAVHTECIEGYKLVGTTCTTCGTGVKDCTIASAGATPVILTCKTGYKTTGSAGSITCPACTVGIANCAECSTSACTKCADDYFKATDGSACTKCSDNCKTCDAAADLTKCTSCDTGYYYVSTAAGTSQDLKCKPFTPANIANCLEVSSTTNTCTKCKPTYGLTLDNFCDACPTNAVDCTISVNFGGAKTASAVTCGAGFFETSLTCVNAISNCAKHTAGGATCTTCLSGFVLNNGQCSSQWTGVSSGCTSGTAGTTTTAAKCSACADGYFLASDACTRCTNNCKTCSSATVCLSCNTDNGYFFDTSAKTCAACTANGNCKTCSTAAKCATCYPGYALTAATGVCADTKYGCSDQTQAAGTCTGCESGFANDAVAKTCTACTAPCATCSGTATKCLTCNSGFVLKSSDSTCNAVANCKEYKSGACNLCDNGYTLGSGVCTICASGCTATTCSTKNVRDSQGAGSGTGTGSSAYTLGTSVLTFILAILVIFM